MAFIFTLTFCRVDHPKRSKTSQYAIIPSEICTPPTADKKAMAHGETNK